MNVSLAVVGLYAVAIAMLAAAVGFVVAGRSRAGRERTAARFEAVAFTPDAAAPRAVERPIPAGSWPAARLLRAGITPQPWHPLLAAVVLAGVAVAGAGAAGAGGAVLAVLIVVGVAVMALRVRTRRVHERRYTQLPNFIDSVLRAVAAGRNIENALAAAREHTPEPLRAVFERVLRRVQLGGDLGEALDEARRVYRLDELALLRLVVVIGQRYGGSMKEPLANIAALIRQHEQNRREVRALTGEVRLSSWIMALLPLGLVVYVLTVNPTYLMTMWHDPSGRIGLVVAALMQVAGVIALWRMVKSVL
jgi:tight adherence protein B